jgi:hypothetical protein
VTLRPVLVTGAGGSGAGGGVGRVTLTANRDFTTTTLGDVTGLQFPVSAGVPYEFAFVVLWQTTLATTGISLAVSKPACDPTSGGRFWVEDGAVTTLTARAFIGNRGGTLTATSDSGLMTTSSIDTANVQTLTRVYGLIKPTADGTLKLRASLEFGVTPAGETVTVLAGSTGSLTTLSAATNAAAASLALYNDPPPAGAAATDAVLVTLQNNDGTPALDENGAQVYVIRRVS